MTVYTSKYPQRGAPAYLALDMIDTATLIVNEQGRVDFANRAARNFFGIPDRAQQALLSDLLGNIAFESAALLKGQLRDHEASTGLHVYRRDSQKCCVRVSKRQFGSDTVVTFEAMDDLRESVQNRLLIKIAEIGNSQLDTPSMCERIIDEIFSAFRMDIAVVALLERGGLKPMAWRGLMLEPEFGASGLVTEEVERALDTNQPVATGGMEWGSGLGDGLTGTHFVTPLKRGERVLGTLHLGALSSVRLFHYANDDESLDPANALDDLDRTFLATLAKQVASALDNAHTAATQTASRSQLKAVVDAIPDGVLVFNSEGEILVSNPESQRISETEWTNLNARRPYRVCDEQGRPLPRPEWPFFQAAAKKVDFRNRRIVFDFGDYARHILADVSHVDSTTLVGTLRDVTQQIESEKRYEEFLSAIGHELRSPLTPLSGLLQIIESRVAADRPVDIELVTRAGRQISRLSRTIDAMLDVTKIETGRILVQRERVDLNRVLLGLRDSWEIHYPQHDIELQLPGMSTIAVVDAGRIEQVLGNLIDNATKNSSAGSKIGVTMTTDQRTIQVSVSDQGVGIDEETLSRIFERFFQGAPGPKNRGIGLGLYISREIVEQHGGQIDVVSTVGEGTAVTVTLPR